MPGSHGDSSAFGPDVKSGELAEATAIRPKESLKGTAVLARTETEAWGLIPNQRQIATPSLLFGHGAPEIVNASRFPRLKLQKSVLRSNRR